ncbi:hypothetical protein AHF37_05196 [Paragonimus kellicotti]|nr:hypothetical protein AHF37_05196 [Paragonimus kellicotti]
MRIATYSGFRPTVQPPIVYGTIQFGKLRTANRMKSLQGSQRFWMLITNMCRVSAAPNRPRQNSRLKTSHPVAFFILPTWQFPLKMGYPTIHENENSLRKAFIYVFGLAISLVSLSALRMLGWFRWPYQVRRFCFFSVVRMVSEISRLFVKKLLPIISQKTTRFQ